VDPWQDIERSIRQASGAPFVIESRAGIGGGCINESHVIRGQGRAFFVKLNAPARADMFAAEAEGLAEIARSNSVRVPHPVCHGASANASWLVLEHLELRPGDDRSMAELGRNLARMHRVTGERYGWHRDNTIGATPQVNTRHGNWIAFWHERRLGYQLQLAGSRGHSGRLIANGERLLGTLPSFFHGYTPPPSLLHGDLWSGNAGLEAGGDPVIYDPAVYYGDREADLAMTELFGGFSQSFYQAYRAEHPLDPGYETRKHLYNLYHVLNHLNLFGGGYGAKAERMIEQLLAAA
jgi:fructosamine-3-kinase